MPAAGWPVKTGFLLILTIFSGAQKDEGAVAAFEARDRCERVGQMAVAQALNELRVRGVSTGSAWFRCQEVRGASIGDVTN